MDVASPTPVTPPASSRRGLRRSVRRCWVWLTTAAVLLIAAGLGGDDLIWRITDVPEMPAFARAIGDAAAEGAGGVSAWQVLVTDHNPVVRLVDAFVIAINQQLDARLNAYAGLVLNVAALGIVLALLSHRLRLTSFALLALALVGVVASPAAAAAPPLVALNGPGAALLLSGLHIGLMTRRRAASLGWWTGLVAGALAIGVSSVGVASAAALTMAALTDRRVSRRDRRWSLFSNLAWLAAGLALVVARNRALDAPATTHALLTLARWPFESTLGAVVVWAPTAAAFFSWIRSGNDDGTREPVGLLAAWSLLQLPLLAASLGGAPAPLSVIAVQLAIGAASAATLRIGQERERTWRFGFGLSWLLLVGCALLPVRGPSPRSREVAEGQAEALAAAVRLGQMDRIQTMPGTVGDRTAARRVVAATKGWPRWPSSIRPPLSISTDAPASAFVAGAAAPLPEQEHLPVLGTWSPEPPYRTGRFVSAPLQTSAPIVQLRVAGTSAPGAGALFLRTNDGRAIAPLAPASVGADRWHRVNFAAPAEPFRVVARQDRSDGWFAFTAPVEIGGLTRWVPKIPRAWPDWVRWTGILAALCVGGATARREWIRIGRTARPRLPWRVVPWLALLGYGVFFSYHLDPTAGPNDSGGYLNSAKLLASGQLTGAARPILDGESDITPYVPTTFHAAANRLVPEYPVGWPLELAAASRVLGLDRSIRWLMVLHLVLGVLVTQRLARVFGLPETWAWLAAGIVGLSPVYLFESLQPVTDGPALVWVGLAVYWAWLSRERPAFAVAAGVATALAVLIRPSNLLAALPILVCLAGRWRQLALWSVAGLPGAAWLAWYQKTLYGGWTTTGYGDVSSGFGLSFVAPTLRSYAIWLPEMLTPIVLLAFALPFLATVPWRGRAVLGSWIAVFVTFYALYWCTWDNWYNMRFVMPAFPAMIVAALLVARAILSRRHPQAPDQAGQPANGLVTTSSGSRARFAASLAALVLLLGFGTWRSVARRVTFWSESNHKPGDASIWAREHLPANAVVFGRHITGSLFYYTNLTFVRSDHPLAQDPAFYERIRQTGRPIYAMTYHWETRGFTWGHGKGTGYPDLPGAWLEIASLGEDEIHVYRLAHPSAGPSHPAAAPASEPSR